LTRPSPQQGLRELRARDPRVCACATRVSPSLSHRSPAPHRRASERASEAWLQRLCACTRALGQGLPLSLAALAQARPSLLRGPSSGLSPRMKPLSREPRALGSRPRLRGIERERERALVNHPHPRDEGARTVGLCASTLGGPATTGRHGTRRPRAREGPPAVSVKTRHFASRPPPPAIPVFPLPTRAGSRPGSRPSMRPHSLEVLNHWARARTRPPLSLEKLELSGSLP